jgi:Leucine-rich repeat (LRR) protein
LDIWSIDLSNNKITDINADYGCLPNLQEINLAYNQITHIKNLGKLTFLKKLELHKNNITDVD